MAATNGGEDFKLTTEEADRLKEALKKEEFRKLLMEYAKEISDPENKKKYEEDILQLEKERGMDVKFVNLKPKFVLKAILQQDKKKLFINVGVCDHVDTPKALSTKLPNGKSGVRWSIPYTITRPREDLHNGKKCSIIDVGFHPDTFNQVDKDHRFMDLLTNTALDGVQNDLGLPIDKKRVKKMKFEYKGAPQPSLIRKKAESDPTETASDNTGPFKFPYPPLNNEAPKKTANKSNKEQAKKPLKKANEPTYGPNMYRLSYHGDPHIQISTSIKRPKELVVSIHLPLLESAKSLELDIYEKSLLLDNESPKYHLHLNLSYPVDDNNSKAKFDKATQTLIITLPVLPPATPPEPHPFTDARPLIEPVNHEEDDSTTTDTLPEVTRETDEPCPIVDSSVRSDWSVNEVWECPPFSYRQNEDCVSLVVHVTRVKTNTLVSNFEDNSAQITFIGSETDQSEFKSYSLYIQFVERVIKPDNCKVDIGTANTVILISKDPNQELQSFKIGTKPGNLTEKLFLTDVNVSDTIHRLSHKNDPWNNKNAPLSTVKVKHKDENECVLQIDSEETTPTEIAMEITCSIMTPPTNGSLTDDKCSSLSNGIESTQDKPMTDQATPNPAPTTSNGVSVPMEFSNDLLYDLD